MKKYSRYYALILASLLLSFLFNCKKETPKVIPTVTLTAATNITANSASVGGSVTADGGDPVIARGVCFSPTNSIPTTADIKTSDGTGTGSFSSSISGLTQGTTYYVNAYATNAVGTAYSGVSTFKTLALAPALTTTDFSGITSASLNSGGTITNDGGSPVTARGVCWSTNQNPTITENKTSDGTGTGSFTSSVSGLTPGTTYFVRAYATNTIGTTYGNQITTRTSATIPTITTIAVSSITSSTATSGGNVTSEGGASVTAKGVCWNTATAPTIANSKTADGTGIGSFVSPITTLSPGTKYYLRAYGTNIAGISYGNEISFTTPAMLSSITTAAITALTSSSAISGGNIVSDGGGAITAKGICWSITTEPTIINSKTTDGTGFGAFISSLTGLAPGVTYYARAYTTNSVGTAYGNEVSFTTPSILSTITTAAITALTSSSAISGGNITADGGGAITARGICWSTTTEPNMLNSKTTDGAGTGAFISSVTGLAPGMTYYARAYSTNSVGTTYGNEVSFTTPSTLSTIVTSALTSITSSSAISGGNITADGGGVITAKGICWSTTTLPNITNNKTTDGTGIGSFVSSITALASGTKYYIRAYAINSAGTSYGNEISFTSSTNLPTLTTTVISAITNNSATSGGTVTSEGGSTVTARGVCWSTTSNPTTSNSKTTDGSGAGSFTSYIVGLTGNTTYYVRAYATNSGGTEYAGQISFTTIPNSSTVTDKDGNIYSTITIGTQTWIASNLKTTKLNDGTAILNVTDNSWSNLETPGYCWYNNNETNNKNTYGALYNFNTVTTYKLCPVGWHVPTDGEWTMLTTYLGGESVAGSKLKETGISHWKTPNTATNETGFTALPGGFRNSMNTYTTMGDYGCWWSSSESSSTQVWTRYLFNDAHVARISSTSLKVEGYSVRCILGELIPPTFATTLLSNINPTIATANSMINDDGGRPIIDRGICWSTKPRPTISDDKTSDGTGIGSFQSSITTLVPEVKYYLRTYATNSIDTFYGNEISFTTPPAVIEFNTNKTYGSLTDIDGNEYKTIQIGSQTWMAENLKTTKNNDGTAIQFVIDNSWSSLITPGYTWYDNYETKNKNRYGALYNWYAANTNKLCPVGWHVPTDDEWTILTTLLGGESIAGSKLKEAGTGHWLSPNTGTNETGFTALPGGFRNSMNTYTMMWDYGYWWSSTSYSSSQAWSRFISHGAPMSRIYSTSSKVQGYSVRCLKD